MCYVSVVLCYPSVRALSVSWAGSLLVSGGADGHILVWSTATWSQHTCIFVASGNPKQPASIWQVKERGERENRISEDIERAVTHPGSDN